MEWLGKELGYEKPEDWYQTSNSQFTKNNGFGFLNIFSNSAVNALKEFFPDYDWKEWLFGKTPNGFWASPDNRRRYMEWLGKELGYEKPEDWYKISKDLILKNHGKALLPVSEHSYHHALKEFYPNYDWKEWLFAAAPNKFWGSPENRRKYMKWLGKELGYEKPEDWYQISKDLFEKNYGGSFLNEFGVSPIKAVKEFHPNYDWKEWLFKNLNRNFWERSKNRRRYMEWLGRELGYEAPENWYQVSNSSFFEHNGYTFIGLYNYSPFAALKEFFPDYDWKEWLFGKTPGGLWECPKNRRRYMEWLGRELGYKAPEDWYKISKSKIERYNGDGLLKFFNFSPVKLVMDFFPDYDWKEWLFLKLPTDFWTCPKNRHRYMEWLGKELKYKEPEDWYEVTVLLFNKYRGGSLLQFKKSIALTVIEFLPNFNWKIEKFTERVKMQKKMFRLVIKIFKPNKALWEYRFDDLKFSGSGRNMGVDVFVPSRDLCFECQGIQHYLPIEMFGGKKALVNQKRRDREKRKAIENAGLTLIEVPYTWDGEESSLRELISQQHSK